jgi:hypothetical protein
MKILDTITDLLPSPTKIMVGVAIFAAVVLGLWRVHHAIDQGGYSRCQEEYKEAAAKHKEESRDKILKTEKRYATIKNKIIRVDGPNDPVGPRVELAIDSVRSPSENNR